MTTTTSKKTPVADVLGGDRDEGLENPTPMKEQENMAIVSAAVPTRIALDERTFVDVDPFDGHVELTVTSHTDINSGPARSTFGIALTATEARKLAEALLDGVAPAFGHAPIEELEEHVRVSRKATVSMSPAKAAKLMREAQE